MVTTCVHEWGEWEKMLWYTPKGRLTGEARKCNKCPAVETRNVEVDSRPAVIQPTIGVFAAIYGEDGRILLKKITSGKFAGEWDLPGGGVDGQKASQSLDERIIGQELVRHVEEEVGVIISIGPMPPMSPAVLKGGGDWAFMIPVEITERELKRLAAMGKEWVSPGSTEEEFAKGELMWVCPTMLSALARRPEGSRLLSGYGKRMHRLCLQALARSPQAVYRIRAKETLLLGWKTEWK